MADDGPGIPTDDRGRVLRRFCRLDTSRSTPGSGLGLALVAAVADLHGAELGLTDNNPGLRVQVRFAEQNLGRLEPRQTIKANQQFDPRELRSRSEKLRSWLGSRVEDVTNAGGELFECEGLADQFHARIQASLMDNRIAGVPGREENLQAGTLLLSDIGQHASAASRQHDVSEE